MYVSVVEYGVQSFPPGMDNWRFVRVEYHKEDEPFAFHEDHIWLPPTLNPEDLENLINNSLQ